MTSNGVTQKRVLLVGDPPAVVKFAEEIEGLDYEVEVIRARHDLTGKIRRGIDFLIAMNLHGKGATVKDLCRKAGIVFISVPPSWTAAREPLRQAGFFPAPLVHALTHQPFATAEGMKAIAHQVIPQAEQAIERASVLAPKSPPPPTRAPAPPPPEPPKREPEVKAAPPPPVLDEKAQKAQRKEERTRELVLAGKTTREILPILQAEFGGARTDYIARVREKTPGAPRAGRSESAAVSGGPPAAARKAGQDANASKRRARVAYFEALLAAGPDLDPVEVNEQVRKRFGRGVSNPYGVRRAMRAKMGLPPAPGTHASNRLAPAPVPVVPAVPGAVAAPGDLPEAVKAAQTALVEALRAAGGVQSYVLTFIAGEAEVEFEAAVTTVAKGKSSL